MSGGKHTCGGPGVAWEAGAAGMVKMSACREQREARRVRGGEAGGGDRSCGDLEAKERSW